MSSSFKMLLFLMLLSVTAHAQTNELPTLNIGDNAPSLSIKKWLKGTPVTEYKKGTVYIVEFWATWCAPCKAAMPHLSELARKYKDSVVVIGVSIMEDKGTPIEKVQHFVDSMGLRMDYTVAMQDSNYMERDWYEAAGERGFPESFIINSEGKIAWFGHPSKLERVLPPIVNNTWDIMAALNTKNINRHLQILDDSLNYDLLNYADKRYKPGDLGRPDSALIVIGEIVKKDPGLKYAPLIAGHTFAALLKTDLKKALEYGKMAIVTTSYDEPPYYQIYGYIERYSNRLKFTKEIYYLGAEAYKGQINAIVYPELKNPAAYYAAMAEMYWRAKDKPQAVKAQQQAIKELQLRKGFSQKELITYKASLQKYMKM